MKKFLFLVGLLTLVLSCTDGNSTNPDDDNSNNSFLLKTEGSYWIYNNKSNDPEAEFPSVQDSVHLKSIEQKDGRDAYVCEEYTDEDNNGNYESKSELETFYAISEGKLYLHKDSFLSPQFGEGGIFNVVDQLEFKDDWVKIADENDDDWDIVESEVEFTVPFFNADIKGSVNAEADNRKETKDFIVNGETVKTQKYEVTMTFTGTATVSILPIPVPVTINAKTVYWIAKGIGPVQIEYKDAEIISQLAGSFPPQYGSTSTLKTYFIAK